MPRATSPRRSFLARFRRLIPEVRQLEERSSPTTVLGSATLPAPAAHRTAYLDVAVVPVAARPGQGYNAGRREDSGDRSPSGRGPRAQEAPVAVPGMSGGTVQDVLAAAGLLADPLAGAFPAAGNRPAASGLGIGGAGHGGQDSAAGTASGAVAAGAQPARGSDSPLPRSLSPRRQADVDLLAGLPGLSAAVFGPSAVHHGARRQHPASAHAHQHRAHPAATRAGAPFVVPSLAPPLGQDPLFVLDANKAVVVTPGVTEHEFSTWGMDLRAQVSGATVSSYSWNLSGAPDAVNVSGQTTFDLQFSWASFTGAARTDTITLTTTNSDNTQQTQTLTFKVAATDSPAWTAAPPTTAATWPLVVTPDTLQANEDTVGGATYQLGLTSGEVLTGHALPGYNPGVAPLDLVYSSAAAAPQPIFLDHYALPTAQALPLVLQAQLTFNNVPGQTVFYSTAGLNPGDVVQLALQANATGLATGRYPYQVAIAAPGVLPVTTQSGQVSVVNDAGSPFGAGWSLGNVERLWPASGGALLELPGGKSLWFAAGSTAGTFVTPAGDFSTLAQNGDGTYTRTLTDGTRINFDSTGRQTSVVDRNGNATSFGYNASNQLVTITDMNGLVTQLAYNAQGKVSSITDPAGRATLLAYDTSGRLTSITDADGAVWGYGYDSADHLTALTDPRTFTTSFSYNAAGSAATVTRADSTTEQLTALQMNGLAAPGTGTATNPAPAVLAAAAQASYTDPRKNVWTARLDWLGFGQAAQAQDPLADTLVDYRDGNGLAWLVSDPLGRRTRSVFDGKGNPTKITLPDDSTKQYAYNGFSEPTQYTDPTGSITSFAYDTKGNLTQLTEPDPDGPGPLTSPVFTYTYTPKGFLVSSTDPLNHTTSYSYDSRNRPTTQTDALGDQVTFGYDSASDLTSRTDQRGFTTTFSYDPMGRLLQETLPDSNPANHPTYTYTYDRDGNQASVSDPLNHTTTLSYDPLDRLTSSTDPLGDTTSDSYDSVGNLSSSTDPLHRTTTFAYDAANRRISMTDPTGASTTYAYDSAGERIAVTDALRRPTTYRYTGRGWLLSVTDPLGDQTTYGYDAVGDQTAVTQSGAGSTSSTTYSYDALHRRILATDPLGNQTSYSWDAAGNLLSVTGPDGDNCGCSGAVNVSYTYDALNRPVTQSDDLGHTTSFGYDAAGNRTSTTDPLNRVTTFSYDPQNRLTGSTDPLGGVISYGYDLAGRQTSLTDPVGNQTTFGYDAANRLTTSTDPLGHSSSYAYDAAGEETGTTDRDGRQTTFGYDLAGRRISETWLNGQGQAIRTISSSYDAAGDLTVESEPDSVYTYSYDTAGRLASVDNQGTPGVPHVRLSYGYDGVNDRTVLTDNLGGILCLTYDNGHHLTGETWNVNQTVVAQINFSYDARNRLSGITRTAGGSGSVSSSFTYDDADRLTGISQTSSQAGTLANYTYAYDAASQLTRYMGPEGTLSYAYDPDGQLTGASGARAEIYSYDKNGNRTMAGYTTGADNRLTSDGTYTYTYDNEGNVLTKTRISDGQVTSFTWDYRNRLTEVVVKTSTGTVQQDDKFTYDVEGRRIGTSTLSGGQQWTVYDGENPYADFNASGVVTYRYLYGAGVDTLLARFDGTNTVWYLGDKLGSVRQLVSTSGAVLDQLTYDSYGNALSESNPANGDRFKYTGREFDSEIGLQENRDRYFDPHTGRWTKQDPMGFGAGDSNLYRYVGNNPTDLVDPLGLGTWAVNPYAKPKPKRPPLPPPPLNQLIPPCPCTKAGLLALAAAGSFRMVQDPAWVVQRYHPGADTSYRIWTGPTAAGNQCTYDTTGTLVTNGPGAGTPDEVSVAAPTPVVGLPWAGHWIQDFLPYEWYEFWDPGYGWQEYHNQGWGPYNPGCPGGNFGTWKPPPHVWEPPPIPPDAF